MLILNAEVDGRNVHVRVRGLVTEIGDLTPEPDEHVIDARGGALLPGLHDHHLHLMAMSARANSVDVSSGLEALTHVSAGTGWIRAVGLLHDADRDTLDRWAPDRPVRVQHHSGGLWILNSAALALVGDSDDSGYERDTQGRATGRLWRLDGWLAGRIGSTSPDVTAVCEQLRAFGITGVTDATPDLDRDMCQALHAQVPQHLQLLGDPNATGPWKIVVADHDLPAAAELIERIRAVRPRAVAVHCVTRAALLLTLAALDDVGIHPDDRIEHAALIPRELAALPVTVVTQPGFLLAHGDRYAVDVPAGEQDELYRYGTLTSAVVPSSDAPYGPADPWQILAAARDRRAGSGKSLAARETVSCLRALHGMLTPLNRPGGRARTVHVGADADLVLLHVGLREALAAPDATLVRGVMLKGLFSDN